MTRYRFRIACTILLLSIFQGCGGHTYLIGVETEKSNSDAIRIAQMEATNAEARGCKVVTMAGGPAVALGLVVGAACVDCQPVQESQRRQTYVVNLLMKCPGANSAQTR